MSTIRNVRRIVPLSSESLVPDFLAFMCTGFGAIVFCAVVRGWDWDEWFNARPESVMDVDETDAEAFDRIFTRVTVEAEKTFSVVFIQGVVGCDLAIGDFQVIACGDFEVSRSSGLVSVTTTTMDLDISDIVTAWHFNIDLYSGLWIDFAVLDGLCHAPVLDFDAREIGIRWP